MERDCPMGFESYDAVIEGGPLDGWRPSFQAAEALWAGDEIAYLPHLPRMAGAVEPMSVRLGRRYAAGTGVLTPGEVARP